MQTDSVVHVHSFGNQCKKVHLLNTSVHNEGERSAGENHRINLDNCCDDAAQSTSTSLAVENLSITQNSRPKCAFKLVLHGGTCLQVGKIVSK